MFEINANACSTLKEPKVIYIDIFKEERRGEVSYLGSRGVEVVPLSIII